MRTIKLSIIASIIGTLVMDLVMLVEFTIADMPLNTYLELIGSVVNGGVIVGILLHILLGAILGLACGAIILKIKAFNISSYRKGIGIGILAGIATIPLCVIFAIITNESISEIVSFSVIPHLVWGTTFGLIVSYGLLKKT